MGRRRPFFCRATRFSSPLQSGHYYFALRDLRDHRRRPRHTPPSLKLPVHLGTTILYTAVEKFARNESIVARCLQNPKVHSFFLPDRESNTRHRSQGALAY